MTLLFTCQTCNVYRFQLLTMLLVKTTKSLLIQIVNNVITILLWVHATRSSLLWRHNGRDGVSNHQPHDCLCLSHIQPRAPCDFYHPHDFLPVRPSEAPVGILRRCCSRGHIRLRAPCVLTRLYTYTYGLVDWFAGLYGYPLGCPYGHRTGPARESSFFLISYGTRTGLVRDPKGCRTTPLRTRKGIDTTRIGKNPTRASYLAIRGPYGSLTVPTRAVHGMFRTSKPVRGP